MSVTTYKVNVAFVLLLLKKLKIEKDLSEILNASFL